MTRVDIVACVDDIDGVFFFFFFFARRANVFTFYRSVILSEGLKRYRNNIYRDFQIV